MIKLSPTSLNTFLDCPLCFWLEKNKGLGIGGPMPTITNGLDRVIKEYMNRYRPNIPPFLQGKVPGLLIESLPFSLKMQINEASLTGRLDECLVIKDSHAPLDHKTKGFAPKNDDVHQAYQLQMDCYSLLLRENGHPVNGDGYIVYYYPDFGELHGGVPFRVHVVRLKTSPQRALKVFGEAVDCLQGEEPSPGEECGVCEFVRERM